MDLMERIALDCCQPVVHGAAVKPVAEAHRVWCGAARALIPDDDDEELIEKAKANRKSRLASEKVAEKEYAKTGGFADGEVVAVQIAVNKLAKSGEALAAGDLPAVAATVGWVARVLSDASFRWSLLHGITWCCAEACYGGIIC